jgi:hypothetical protein
MMQLVGFSDSSPTGAQDGVKVGRYVVQETACLLGRPKGSS